MKTITTIGLSFFAATAIAGTALAQATGPSTTPSPPPAATPSSPSVTTSPTPSSPSRGATAPATHDGASLTLTDDQARQWVSKKIYGSDNKSIGEVVTFTRDTSGKVTELMADIGGFLGIGETRVRVMPAQFMVVGDRIVLNMTADQAKALPKVEK